MTYLQRNINTCNTFPITMDYNIWQMDNILELVATAKVEIRCKAIGYSQSTDMLGARMQHFAELMY